MTEVTSPFFCTKKKKKKKREKAGIGMERLFIITQVVSILQIAYKGRSFAQVKMTKFITSKYKMI